MLVLTLSDVVAEMVQSKCGQLGKRDRGTLQRGIDKVIRQFLERVELC